MIIAPILSFIRIWSLPFQFVLCMVHNIIFSHAVLSTSKRRLIIIPTRALTLFLENNHLSYENMHNVPSFSECKLPSQKVTHTLLLHLLYEKASFLPPVHLQCLAASLTVLEMISNSGHNLLIFRGHVPSTPVELQIIIFRVLRLTYQ